MKKVSLIFIMIFILFLGISCLEATTLTDSFVQDTNQDTDANPWNEDNAYAPEPVLFIHGFNSHCKTWGGPLNPERLTINKLMEYYKVYRKYFDQTKPITLSDNTQSKVYDRVYLETIEFSNNLGHPADQAKELAYRIMYDNDNPSSWPSGWPKPRDFEQGGFNSILKEYYSGNNWSNSANKLIIVAHSMGGLAAREFLTNSQFVSIAGDERHISKLIMIGTPNLGSYWATMGRTAVYINCEPIHSIIGNVASEVLYAAETLEAIANHAFKQDILNSEAVKAMDPLYSPYILDLYDQGVGHPNMSKCRTLAGYSMSGVVASAYHALGKIKSGGSKTVGYAKDIIGLKKALVKGTVVKFGTKCIVKAVAEQLMDSDGVVSSESQLFSSSDNFWDWRSLGQKPGLINPARAAKIPGVAVHMDTVPGTNINIPWSETNKYENIFSIIDEAPILDIISPVPYQEINEEKILVEGRFWDYLPASVALRVYAGPGGEIGLAVDKSPKPLNITNTIITNNGKYNAGFSFELKTGDIGPGEQYITVLLENAAGKGITRDVRIKVAMPLKTQLYYQRDENSPLQPLPKGTQIVITKITPKTVNNVIIYEEEFFKQTLVGDDGWINIDFVPKDTLRYRLIADSINKDPALTDPMPRSTVCAGETGRYYRLITPMMNIVFASGKYIAKYVNSNKKDGDIILTEEEVGVRLGGYLTTLNSDPDSTLDWSTVYYHNKPQTVNILRLLNKAHAFLSAYDPESKVISCGYSKDKDLTISGATYYGYNPSHTKRRLFINSISKDEWNQDAILQGYGNMLSNRYMRLEANYWPQWGARINTKQALTNGWCQYFNSMSRDSKKINILGSERDLGAVTAKGANDERAIAGALVELGRFGLVWPKIMESFNAGQSILNINDLYEIVKGQNFSPQDVDQIFIKYGLKPKLVSVQNTNTTRPIFTWDRNEILLSISGWDLQITQDDTFQSIYYEVNDLLTESYDTSVDLGGGSFFIGLPGEGQYYWRVRAQNPEIDNFYSLTGQFNINLSFINITSAGGTVPIGGGGGGGGTTPVRGKIVGSQQMAVGSKTSNQRLATSNQLTGTFEIPAGAVSGEVKINVTPMTTSEMLGDYVVFGQKLYEIYPDEYAFQKACAIKYNVDGLGTDANGYGIYRYDFQTKDWDFAGAEYLPADASVAGDSNTKIMSSSTNKLGIYGVLRDTKAPEITNIVDSPDPFSPNSDGANDATTFNYELNKACNVGIHIVGRDTDITLAGGLQKTRMNQTTWDGKDNQGKIVPDGKYSYTITATDLLGGQTAAGGTTFVFTQKPGAIKGHVLCNGQNVADARIRMVSSTLETRTDAGGNFELTDVPPSAISTVNVEVLKKGYFREVFENISLAARQTINLGNIDLSNQAVMAHRVTPAEFSPNNDSYKDQLYLNYTLNRKAPITILIKSDTSLQTPDTGKEWKIADRVEKDMGNNVTTWDGRILTSDQRPATSGRIAPSGIYSYQIYAQAEEENILQAEGTFILNNGLLKNIRCLNELFSPNGDGRDDTCEIVYEMENSGMVDLKIYNSQNQEIASLMDKVTRIPGNYSVEWDGKKQIADSSWQTVDDGQYTYKITSYFEEGMLSNTQTGSITVDQNPPELTNLIPVNGSHTTKVMPVIRCKINTVASRQSLAASETELQNDIDEDRIRLKIDDFYVPITYNPTTGEIIFTPGTSLGIGAHIIVVYAADKAGNEAAPLSNVFYIDSPGADNIKPQVKELSIVGLVQTINGYEVYSGKPSVIAKLFDENSGIDINSITLEIDGERVVNQSKTIDIMHALPAGKVDSLTKKNYWLEQWLYTKEILLYNPQTGILRYNFLDELADNSNHLVKLQARDISGNVAMEKEFTFKVNIDRAPPTITELMPLNNSTIKATKPVISCKLADDKSQLDLYSLRFLLDGVEQEIPANAFNSSNGLLEFKCPLTLKQDTQHIITLDISDMAGNKATQAMSVFTIKGDKIAPVIVELTPEDGALVTNKRPTIAATLVDNGDSLVDNTSISLEIDGDNISNTNLIIQQDSQKANTVNVSYVPANNLADGEHLLVMTAEDDSNNQANPRSAMFRIGDDNVAPVIDQLKPENNSTITVLRPLISARLKDDGTGINPSSIVLKIDGQTKKLPEGSYSSATNMLTYVPDIYLTDNAQHIVTIDVKDKAGNSAVRARSVFNVRSLIVGAANVSEIYPEAGGYSNKKPTPIKINLVSANGTIVPFNSILLSLDSQVRPHVYNISGGEVKFASDPVLPEGLHSIKLEAEDNVGNQIYVESSFTMDYTKPVISLTKDIRDGDYVASLESIDFNVVENLSGVDENSINIMIDNENYSGFNYLASANKLTLAQAEPISDGMHTIELQVSDRATNPSDKKTLRVQIAGDLTVEEVVNFPNPFPREGTKFTCQLSKPANIRIRIYTITGELVKRIETEGQAGYNEFFWDATNDWGRKIAQGAYPYIFEADDGSNRIKVNKTCVMKR